MGNEWGPVAQFMYRVERKAKCEYLAFKDYYLGEERWEAVEMNGEGGHWWSTKNTPDTIRTCEVRYGDDFGEFSDEWGIRKRKYKVATCRRRSCFSCQRPRMRRWKKRIVQRAESSDRKLYFVTLTLPGDADGRWAWSSSLNSTFSELQNWWRLSRVKVNVGKARSRPYVNSTSNCVRVFEIPENENGSWNPHVHVLTESDRAIGTVRDHWRSVWQQDGIRPRLQVKPVISQNELADYVTKVTKYMTKGEAGNPDIDTVMYRKHNVSFCGEWRYANTIKEDEEE